MTAVLVFLKLYIYIYIVISKVMRFFQFLLHLFCWNYTKRRNIPIFFTCILVGLKPEPFLWGTGSQIMAIPLSHHPWGKTNVLWKKRRFSIISIGIHVPYFIEILVLWQSNVFCFFSGCHISPKFENQK